MDDGCVMRYGWWLQKKNRTSQKEQNARNHPWLECELSRVKIFAGNQIASHHHSWKKAGNEKDTHTYQLNTDGLPLPTYHHWYSCPHFHLAVTLTDFIITFVPSVLYSLTPWLTDCLIWSDATMVTTRNKTLPLLSKKIASTSASVSARPTKKNYKKSSIVSFAAASALTLTNPVSAFTTTVSVDVIRSASSYSLGAKTSRFFAKKSGGKDMDPMSTSTSTSTSAPTTITTTNGDGIAMNNTYEYSDKKVEVKQERSQTKSKIHATMNIMHTKTDPKNTAAASSDPKPDAQHTPMPISSVPLLPRTQSFAPQWHGTFHPNTSTKIHTLILGTHPSITSLAKVQYFAHPLNAFWWIAGDCLGFRRASGISPSSGKAYKLSSHLVHGEEKVIPYEEQMELFTCHGFALWDLLGSCERKGSLDVDIKDEMPNQIREFCQQHSTIKRIVMANGAKQCTFFNKYFEDWWMSGELKPGENELSRTAFKKWAKHKKHKHKTSRTNDFENAFIEVYCLPGVSPAAASISYEVKRDAYREYCYEPGLLDHERLKLNVMDSS